MTRLEKVRAEHNTGFTDKDLKRLFCPGILVKGLPSIRKKSCRVYEQTCEECWNTEVDD